MKPSFTALSIAVAAALLLASATSVAASSSREACTPRPAGGEPASQSADAMALHLDAARPAALANWDARSWQRHRVRIALEASNAGDAATQLLPEMLVDARPDGDAAMVLVGPPVALAPHGRVMQRLAVWVPDDARTLGVRALSALPPQPVAVTFALECSDSRYDPGEIVPAIAPLLDEAERLWINGFVDPLSDSRAVFESVRRLSSGAQDTVDVAWALRGMMQAAHDDHGWIVGPGEPAPARPVLVTRAPELELNADDIAVVRLHAVDTGADAAALAWAAALHDGIAALAARHPRAWIVDLRDHDGDSPWPSFAALSTLFDGPAVGAFVSRHDKQEWIVERGAARVAGGPPIVDLQAPPEPNFRGPVAILLGPGTRDAGEDVAVAFRGRARTRFFGAPTAGFPLQGVQPHRLADGSTLGVLEVRAADRTGLVHRAPLEPDAVLKDDAARAAWPQPVLDWLFETLSGGR
jgi:hypothetical protein